MSDTVIHHVERAIADMRRGVAVYIYDEASCSAYQLRALEMALEDMSESAMLALTSSRAKNVLPESNGPLAITLPKGAAIEEVASVAGLSGDVTLPKWVNEVETHPLDTLGEAAMHLCKLAELMPAALLTAVQCEAIEQIIEQAHVQDQLVVSSAEVMQYEDQLATTLRPVCEAPLVLKDAKEARIVVFRSSASGKEHYAIIIGDITKVDAPYVRIHSACYTGDVLASLRCDCRDQLHEAVSFMGTEGAGVILYMMQEGRGIGLANKLRAYALQAESFDTVDANAFLGFEDDERSFLAVATMLKHIDVHDVKLLTNNPRKVKGLTAQGINATRVAHQMEPHEHNEDYLHTKRERLGHMHHD